MSRLTVTCLGIVALMLANACGDDRTPVLHPTQPSTVTPPQEAPLAPQPQPPSSLPPSDGETTLGPILPVGGGERIFVGAGDIADCAYDGVKKTANLLDRLEGTVFTAGDNVYMNGTPAEFSNCYGPTWGRHLARTRPTPGNHDYGTAGATGYYAYYGANAGPPGRGYYSYELGAWHIVSLNSNVPVDAGSAQVAWLRSDLQANPRRCTLAYYHHPLFSSGQNGGEDRMRTIWRVLHSAGVDVIINGHDHVYERFARQDADGRFDARGVRQFTIGTGGARKYGFPNIQRNSEVRAAAWGVMRFALRADEYSWDFIPVDDETFRDSGRDSCH